MSHDPSDPGPVFITGTPRSGTTLLYRTLLKHSSFATRELCLEETRIFLHSFLALKSSQHPAPLLNYMLKNNSAYRDYLDSIKWERFLQKVCRNLRISFIIRDKNTRWKVCGNSRVVKTYFHHARRARGCSRIVEKTPRHLLYTGRIFHTFPEAKMIVIIRHPVDVFSSYQKRKQVDPDSDWLEIGIDDFVNRYRNMTRIASVLLDQQKAWCVKYENFVKHPEAEFTDICTYIGEPFEKKPLVEDEPELNDFSIDPYLAKPITKKTKDWADYLKTEEVSFIEDRLKDEMKMFGYPSVFERGKDKS